MCTHCSNIYIYISQHDNAQKCHKNKIEQRLSFIWLIFKFKSI